MLVPAPELFGLGLGGFDHLQKGIGVGLGHV